MITLTFIEEYNLENIEVIELKSFEDFFYFYKENHDKGYIYDVNLKNGGNFMKEVIENLFITNQEGYENNAFSESEWSIALVAKEPFHRQAVGYTGRACAKDHPEYLIARRDNKLILNLVDAPKAEFFNKNVIDTALDFIDEELSKGKKVLVACNQGESRSASIVLLYLIKKDIIITDNLEDAEVEFLKLYPNYNPGTGMRGFVKEHFDEYKYPCTNS